MPTPIDADVVVRTLAGPWGPLHVAASVRGIVAAESAVTDDAFRSALQRRLGDTGTIRSTAVAPDDLRLAMLDRAETAITELLAGGPPHDDVPVDLADRPVWDQRVLAAVRAVPWGRTASYGDIARRIGAPRAARAVGGALGRNPVTLLIPCHRVIAADGTIGGYGGEAWGGREAALERKRSLLAREGVTVAQPDG
jgi:methylated-DNA-[protein]-cysteine S-methyltransferase